jgi:hypothetical protein
VTFVKEKKNLRLAESGGPRGVAVASSLQAEKRASIGDNRQCAHLKSIRQVDLLLCRDAHLKVDVAAPLTRGDVSGRDQQLLERSCKGR